MMRRPATMRPGRQAAIGVGLASLLIAAWVAAHVYGVFLFRWDGAAALRAPLLLSAQCWLSVGLFIVAHDAMHGSLAPFRPAVNRAFGRLALALYAGFSYDRLTPKHFDHHRHAGTALDPDFDENHPDAFWPWYAAFLRQYFGWREFFTIGSVVTGYMLLLGAHPANVVLFFALPAILSSLQLFAFGTYLPHRREESAFADRHNARSSDYGWLLSFLTCFHFGYHHEHHLRPELPWWRLPASRAPSRPAGADASRAQAARRSRAAEMQP